MNFIMMIGAVLGLMSVIMAAWIDHGLSHLVDGKMLAGLSTAVRYHQLYAVFITMLGVVFVVSGNRQLNQWILRTSLTFIIGIILFSFSIYGAAALHLPVLLHLTPVGGVILMLGWAVAIIAAIKIKA